MKIGIITLPPAHNYGGILQAYALSHVLQGMGHEAEVIYMKRRPYRLPLWRKPLAYAKRAVRKYILRRPNVYIFIEEKREREWPILIQNTFGFVESHIPYRVFDGYETIKEDDYDAFVVGSDQVWRLPYFGLGNIREAYLHFAEGWKVKRIAYAASFGVDYWEYTPKDTAECARLARLFDAITVREASGVDLCREYLGVDVAHVVDPTLLLEREDYESLIDDDSTPHKGEILNYILDQDDYKRRIINRLEQSTGKPSFRVNARLRSGMPPQKSVSSPAWSHGCKASVMPTWL